jgi:phthiocerol/phenolphthiocerol synthesis type-I polyketide synthase E
VRARFGRLHGVIHAAGVADGELLARIDVEQAEAVLRAKVAGTRGLLAGLVGEELEFMLLCSSLSALSGGVGQASYAAANAVLDAFAADAALRGLPVCAIDWDAWQDVGMAARSVFHSGLPSRQHAPGQATGHVLIETCILETSSEAIYESRFSAAQHWVLDEHRIDGLATMPGTAYLEMARAACAHFAAIEQVELQDVLFVAPLVVPEDTTATVQTRLKRSQGGIEISIISLEPQDAAGRQAEREHMRALATPAAPTLSRRHDLASLARRCGGRTIDIARGEQPMTGSHMRWGQRWQSLREVAIGESEAFGTLELPSCFLQDLNTFLLHPALLDVATSFALPWLAAGDYLPVAAETIRVYGPLPASVHSYVTVEAGGEAARELLTVSVALIDEQGLERASIEGLTMRGIDENIAAALKKSIGEHSAATRPELIPTQISRSLQQRGWIRPEEGAQILLHLLGNRLLPQVIVTARDLTGLLEEMRTLTRTSILDALAAEQSARGAHARPPLPTEYVAPRTEIERGIVQIWECVLGIEPIGIYDDFFELGGHSLLATQVLSRVRDAFQLQIRLRHLFEATTVAGLAEQIERARADSGQLKRPPIRAVDRDAYRAERSEF